MNEAPSVACEPVKLTDEQRANLATLAAYLRTLPAHYPDFEMSDYAQGGGSYAHVACGTAACAVGHGPSAGIAPQEREQWESYSQRVFIGSYLSGTNHKAWSWCFSGEWSDTDNSVHGAAARIEWLLKHGVPRNGIHQRYGTAPLCYAVEGAA